MRLLNYCRTPCKSWAARGTTRIKSFGFAASQTLFVFT
jgi:hypothetical protein